MTMGGKKVMTRGRRSKINDGQKNNNLIANRGFKSSVHWHTLMGSVWNIAYAIQSSSVRVAELKVHSARLSLWFKRKLLN
jgi:hypothetical protein